MGNTTLIRRIRDEFAAMPGLRLTGPQLQRLCAADRRACSAALATLTTAGVLQRLPDGTYARSDVIARRGRTAAAGTPLSPMSWRRLLCVVTPASGGEPVSAASARVLRYTMAAATPRHAHVTAFWLADRHAEASHARRERVRAAIRHATGRADLHLVMGVSVNELRQAAVALAADVAIVSLDQHLAARLAVSDFVASVPCPVLLVGDSADLHRRTAPRTDVRVPHTAAAPDSRAAVPARPMTSAATAVLEYRP